jgi:hypothetical protein
MLYRSTEQSSYELPSLLAEASPLKQRLSLGTSYVALVLLAASLVIGPFNLMVKGSSPVSTYLRRDVGIFASLFALFHVILGLQVHFAGDIARYVDYHVTAATRKLRTGLSNTVNAIQATTSEVVYAATIKTDSWSKCLPNISRVKSMTGQCKMYKGYDRSPSFLLNQSSPDLPR